MQSGSIFRKVALDRLSSPEQLDRLLTIVRPRDWLALLGAAVVVAAGLYWGIQGTVPTKVAGQGILISGGGVHQILPPASGRLVDIRIQEGDFVRRGEVVARLAQPQLAAELETLHQRVEQLRRAVEGGAGAERAQRALELAEAEAALARLQEEYLVRSRVVSAGDGRVLEVKKKNGDYLLESESLASYEMIRDDTRLLEAVLFVRAEEGQKILPGMEVQVSPLTARIEEHGYILGKVISVSEYPLSPQAMLNLLGNEELARRFSAAGAPVEVRVELVSDPRTESGYRWSIGEGPPTRLQSGTLVNAAVIVKAQRPIRMILP